MEQPKLENRECANCEIEKEDRSSNSKISWSQTRQNLVYVE